MPKLISSTPSWLRRPSPGSDLFAPLTDAKTTEPASPGPRRIIARRDTEVFVAVGNQIRWADLALLQAQWKERLDKNIRRQSRRQRGEMPENVDEVHDIPPYRLLKVSVWEDIRQLTVSPNGNLIAILTSHTAHVAILPDPAYLRGPDTGPVRLKTYTVGPTCHVLSQPPIMSAIWHPLGVLGNCLVTVTAEAIVRVWEFSIENRWSFDSPTLLVDLKRLADGLPPDQSLAASKLCANKGFSPDSFEMEVAAACFGGGRSADQNGWAPMTLWIAMREGDVYALCPLLPFKWSPPSRLLPSLSLSLELNEDDNPKRRQVVEEQRKWIEDINNHDPLVKPSGLGSETKTLIYTRSEKPGHIPSLQGPFELDLMPEDEDDEDVEVLLTDIYVKGAKLEPEEVFNDDDEEVAIGLQGSERLSVGVICLSTNTGRVHVLLDVEGVRGRWVSGQESNSSEINNDRSLLHFESIDMMRPEVDPNLDLSWPLFSQDPCSEYSFFLTHPQGVTYLSFSKWVERLEDELRNGASEGVNVRLDVILKTASTTGRRIINWADQDEVTEHPESVTASVLFKDASLGYFLLTSTAAGPSAALFDLPPTTTNDLDQLGALGALTLQDYKSGTDMKDVTGVMSEQRRAAYQPALVFSSESPLGTFLESRVGSNRHGGGGRSMKAEIRFSQSTLNLLTDAHRVVGAHIHTLGSAAAELFRQCERMQREFSEQIRNVDEALHRVEDVIDENAEEEEEEEGGEDGAGSSRPVRGEKAITRRIQEVNVRQEELVKRFDALERKVALSGGRELSEKEKAWMVELRSLGSLILAPAGTEDGDGDGDDEDPTSGGVEGSTLWKRHQEIKRLTRQLLTEVQKTTTTTTASSIQTPSKKENRPPLPSSNNTNTKPARTGGAKEEVHVPSFIRKQKIQQVLRLLERESALVDNTKERLERLSLVVT
ncbi:MAG: hypothetical protein M1816_002667 [Peltula sp. TS41687]|nr:MAG: hypothetical protein M1816_002667 [Peltula sp. TS41687]